MVKYGESENLDYLFMALAHKTRREILCLLKKGVKTAQELALPFSMSLPAISKHLKILERAKLVKRDVQGRCHFFTIEPDKLHEAIDWVNTFDAFWNEKLNNLEKYVEKD